MQTEDALNLGFAIPYVIFMEPDNAPPGVTTALSCSPVSCDNPACPDGCHNVAILIVSAGKMFSYRYSPDVARKFAQSIIDAADVQDAMVAKRDGKVN